MARSTARGKAGEPPSSSRPAADPVEQKVVALAEQMGRLIGTIQAKAEGWLEGQSLHDQLNRIRESAAEVLTNLTQARASRASSGGKPEAADTTRTSSSTPTTSARGGSGGVVDAPGKKHRAPAPTAHGVKHSDERIAKMKLANEAQRRRSD